MGWLRFLKEQNRTTFKPILSGHSKIRPNIGFQDRLSLNEVQKYCRMLQWEHSAILLTFIKQPSVIKICVLSIFEWPLKTSFRVANTLYFECSEFVNGMLFTRLNMYHRFAA